MSEAPEDQPPLKRPNDTPDVPMCSKPKKCRRGKKKRFRNRAKNQNNGENVDSDGFKIPLPPPPGNAEKPPSRSHRSRRRKRKIIIRPVDVPKAPENSTQFIIDDHDECHLYFSFETPNPYNQTGTENKTENYEEDAAFQDIDYQYESLQDVDNSAYYIQDFETNYFNMRYEEIMRLPRQDILNSIETLETRVKELEDKLCQQDPKLALEQLQQKLLHLQEENHMLQERNLVLKKALEDKPNSGETSNTSLDDSSQSADQGSHSCGEECSSSGSSHHSEDENSGELVMEEIYPQDEGNYLPEYNADLHITYDHDPDESSEDENDSGEQPEFAASNDERYSQDINVLQNNYRAHRISEEPLSDSSADNHNDHFDYDYDFEDGHHPEDDDIGADNSISDDYESSEQEVVTSFEDETLDDIGDETASVEMDQPEFQDTSSNGAGIQPQGLENGIDSVACGSEINGSDINGSGEYGGLSEETTVNSETVSESPIRETSERSHSDLMDVKDSAENTNIQA